ncbi:MAG: hypothetical protein JWO67_4487 [Streptosporangiaceae bacterium]|nr:hypothetical protein [Streptosporangiaceae bacterium]
MTHQYRPPPNWATWWKRWERCPDCGKRGYRTRDQARRVRREQIQTFGEKLSQLNVYKCRDGNTGLFHLGHPSIRSQQAS